MKKLIVLLLCITLFFSLSISVCASDVSPTADEGFTFGTILEFIKDIFVPSTNYFNNKIAVLNNNINDRLGGVAYLFQMINSFFDTLKTAPLTEFNFSVPDGMYGSDYKGFSIDVFSMAKPFIRILRSVSIAFMCLFTGIICYKKLIKLFEK